MDRRPEFQTVLKNQFGSSVTPHVYFQPPESVRLVYPCIVYKLDDIPAVHANNKPYHWNHRYEVTVIDKDPDSVLREQVKTLPTCRFARAFTSDNLHHYVFEIYY